MPFKYPLDTRYKLCNLQYSPEQTVNSLTRIGKSVIFIHFGLESMNVIKSINIKFIPLMKIL